MNIPTIAVSGGFDPVHRGHVQMIREASQYGNVLVILNSDEWLIRKKGYKFMSFEERAYILGNIKGVTIVTSVDDSDGTVCKALERFKPDAFANGGDFALDRLLGRRIGNHDATGGGTFFFHPLDDHAIM